MNRCVVDDTAGTGDCCPGVVDNHQRPAMAGIGDCELTLHHLISGGVGQRFDRREVVCRADDIRPLAAAGERCRTPVRAGIPC